jgi:hypothetical protein
MGVSNYGATAIIAGVSLFGMMVAIGTAISFSIQQNAKSELQQALDGAVLAGTSMRGTASEAARLTSARDFFDTNSKNITGERGDRNVMIRITGDPVFAMQSIYLVGDVEAEVYSPLGGFLGKPWLKVNMHAAARKRLSDPVCVLGLDPTQAETIDFNGQAELEAINCAVQSNSDSGAGINQKGQPLLKAKSIGVTGKAKGSRYQPPPIEGTSRMADPFQDLEFPSSRACDPSDKGQKIQNQTITLYPGTYCGGLKLMAGSNVTFAPGEYVFKNGPLWIISGAVVHGDDVLLAFTGANATLLMDGSSELRVTSPSSGPYTNMQFFSDPDMGDEAAWGLSLVGNVTLEYDGAMYMPGQNIWFGGGTVVEASSPGYAIVGDKVWVQDHSTVKVTLENKRGLAGFAAATGYEYGAVLVE